MSKRVAKEAAKFSAARLCPNFIARPPLKMDLMKKYYCSLCKSFSYESTIKHNQRKHGGEKVDQTPVKL